MDYANVYFYCFNFKANKIIDDKVQMAVGTTRNVNALLNCGRYSAL